MKNTLIRTAFALVCSMWLFSCSSDNATTVTPGPSSSYSNGIVILNEGVFSSGTGTVSFYSNTDKTTTDDIFNKANNRPLGNIGQSILRIGSNYYISVNNGQKLEITDLNFTSVNTLNGFNLPDRMLYAGGGKLYVTEWNAFGKNGNVVVVNTLTQTIYKKISVGPSPSRMLLLNNQLLVANGDTNTISVIDITTDSLINTITVNDRPNSFALYAGNRVFVLCGGTPSWASGKTETAGSLVKLKSDLSGIENAITFPNTSDHPEFLMLSADGNSFYFGMNNSIYQMASNASSIPAPTKALPYYQLHFNRNTNTLYATDAKDFVSKGKVYVYSMPGFVLSDSINAGIIPRDLLFN